MSRCRDKGHSAYAAYGGRGIKVCERWHIFTEFLEDMGECPDGYEIDRIDNSLGYYPTNCRWADSIQQGRNRTISLNVTYDGTTRHAKEWASLVGIKYDCLGRLLKGWDAERALTTPTMTASQASKLGVLKRYGARPD